MPNSSSKTRVNSKRPNMGQISTTLDMILGIDDLPAFLLVYFSEAGAFSRFGIDTIEGSVAASAVNETVACFHAKGAIANLNEPASKA